MDRQPVGLKDPSPAEVERFRRILGELNEAQWYGPEQLAAYQSKVLGALLRHAKLHVPYYAESLRKFPSRRLADMDVTALSRLPLLERQVLGARRKEFVADEVPAEHGGSAETETSGSTGTPVVVHVTEMTLAWGHAYHMRDHYWHQRDLSRTLAVIRSKPPRDDKVRKFGSWGVATSVLHQTGPAYQLHIANTLKRQVGFLREVGPEYLLTFPTNIEALAEYCLDRGERLDSLMEVRTLSEALPQETRDLVREAFGVKIADVYSCRELGSLAIQCPEHEHYHVSAENVVVEVLDENDRPCAPGEVGRIVVTGLRNFSTPLIRYDIGDFAELGEPCPCGRGLPVFSRIIGRRRNRVCLPDGRRLWPTTGYRRISKIPQIRRIQFVQNEIDAIEVRIVASEPLSDEVIERLRKGFAKGFHHEFRFDFRYVDDIPRSAGGKFEEVVCNV